MADFSRRFPAKNFERILVSPNSARLACTNRPNFSSLERACWVICVNREVPYMILQYLLYFIPLGTKKFVSDTTVPFSARIGPDRHCGPRCLLFNGHCGFSPRLYSGLGVQLTIHLHPVPRFRLRATYFHSLRVWRAS